MKTFNPDANGECLNCDEWGSEHLCPNYPHTDLLNEEQERAAREWAADDRLWTTQETVEFNLRAFARAILKAAQP